LQGTPREHGCNTSPSPQLGAGWTREFEDNPMLKDHADLVADDRQSKTGWGPSHAVLAGILKTANASCGVEVGSAFAGNAESILLNTDVQRLYLVDPYQHFPGYDDPMNVDQDKFDRIYLYVIEKLRPFGSRACVIRGTSKSMAKIWEEPVDFVFIDAEHTYEAVVSDVIAWLPHVKVGGLITGHDYKHENFPGVTQAVNDVFGSIGWTIEDAGAYVWAVKKKRDISTAELVRGIVPRDTKSKSKSGGSARRLLQRLFHI
jgi:hypothetical protein